MPFKARVVLDSVNPCGNRLTTMEVTYPRFIHSEILTHRDRARNSASSRAIPWKRWKQGKNQILGVPDEEHLDDLVDKCMFKMIMTEPVIPIKFGREQKGMQSGDNLEGEQLKEAHRIWIAARDAAVAFADELADLGVHKSICNRLTEPFMWITVVMTATEWRNFYRLRCHPAAEPHFNHIANMMRDVMGRSNPQRLEEGEWHLPYLITEEMMALTDTTDQGWVRIMQLNNALPPSFMEECKGRVLRDGEIKMEYYKRISTARCARVSYLTHDGVPNIEADLKLANTLIRPPGDADEEIMHASPFEHIAEAMSVNLGSGPFRGWKQYRKEFKNENVEG